MTEMSTGKLVGQWRETLNEVRWVRTRMMAELVATTFLTVAWLSWYPEAEWFSAWTYAHFVLSRFAIAGPLLLNSAAWVLWLYSCLPFRYRVRRHRLPSEPDSDEDTPTAQGLWEQFDAGREFLERHQRLGLMLDALIALQWLTALLTALTSFLLHFR